MILQVDKVVDGETMAQVAMMVVVTTTEEVVVEEDMAVEVAAATAAVEVMVEVEETEEVVVEEDMEAEVVAVVEEVMVASVMITGAMKEWEEAGEVVETVEVWTTTGVGPSSTIRSPSIKACVVATARLILPLLLLHILRNPSHTEFNLKNSTLLSTKHARTPTIVRFTLRT